MTTSLLAQLDFSFFGVVAFVIVPVLLVLFFVTIFVRQYKRCPSNRILVVYGRVGGSQAAKCLHGGSVFVVPLLQDYAYLSLEPMTIDIDLKSALSKKNIRVNVPSTFTIGISTRADIMNNAAERLLGQTEDELRSQARDIILGQMRLVLAMMVIEEINQDREKFLDAVNKNVDFELNKIGLEVINVNIRDITDESGYIEAIGQKAAAEAVNRAKVEVAEANKEGAIGEATAGREMKVRVASQDAQAAIGRKEAERDQRITVAGLEAEGIAGEAAADREQQIARAKEQALAVQGQKEAEQQQRVRVAELEADAVEGENQSKAEIADYEATLSERRAEAKRKGEVALAQSSRDVLLAQKEEEMARQERDVIVKQEIERKQVEIDAEAEAERRRRIARGEADAVLAKYEAEAEGLRKVLESKAAGYEKLLEMCGDQKHLAPTLLMVEKVEDIVAEQVKAIQNLKIDKVTVWDGAGGNGEGSTAGFLRGLIGALPPMHELAKQAGVELPELLGKLEKESKTASSPEPPSPEAPSPEKDESAPPPPAP